MELVDPSMSRKYTFRHFDTAVDCTHYVNNTQRPVAYFCCGGKGVAYEQTVYVFRPIEIKGTCDICFQEEVSLVKPCGTCVNTLCGSCLSLLPQKICPYCRSAL